MAKPVKDVPPPLEGNDRMVAAAGTVVWAAALIVLVALDLTGHLPAARHWWLWTCVAGIGLGLFAALSIPWIKSGKGKPGAEAVGAGQPGGTGG